MIRRIILLAVLLVLAVSVWQAHLSVPGMSVGRDHVNELLQATSPQVANVEIAGESSPDRQRVEPTIAVDPHNPSVIVAGAQDLGLKAVGQHRWHGYYRSTDGGQTWSSSLLPGFPGDTSPQGLQSPLHRSNATSDPVMAFDRNGNLYYAGIVFNITSSGQIGQGVVFVAKYRNDGAAYANVTLIPGVLKTPSGTVFFGADKPWLAADTTGGPNDGNLYLVLNFGVFTRSTDGGRTFFPWVGVPTDGSGLAVDAVGDVFVSNTALNGTTSQYFIQVTKLTGGGSVLAGTITAVKSITPLPGTLPGGGFRIFTLPQMAADSKGVYVAWDDYRTGNANVMFTSSGDSGRTWSSPIVVNDVTSGQHFFPTIVASGGVISVAWYDSRLNAGTNMTALDVFLSQSANTQVSFYPSIRVTSVSFDPNKVLRTDLGPIYQPFLGDYIGIAAFQGVVYPVWTDNRNACDTVDLVFGCVDQDVFTVPEKLSLPVSSFSSLDGSNVSINGIMLVDRLLLGVSGNLTVTAVNSTSGAMIFSRAYSIPSLPLTSVSGPANQALFGLNVPVMPYALSCEVKVVLQGTSVTASTLLTRELDINANGSVDIIDAGIAALSFGTSVGNPKYNPQADFLAHGTVDIVDLGVFAFYFNAPVFH